MDGVLRGTVARGYTSAPTDPSWIGLRGDSTDYFRGKMDEVGIWTRVLTQAEISQLYLNGAGLQHPFSIGQITF